MKKTLSFITALLAMLLLLSAGMAQTLRLDDEGEEVRKVQQAMAKLGIYYAQATGHYGSKTAACVKDFQRRYGLARTGEADDATRAALYKAAYGKAEAVPPAEDDEDEGDDGQDDDEEETRPAAAPSPASAYSASGTLRYGSTGDAVRQLQKDLKALGFYKGAVTGHYGGMTRDAVRAFQRAKRLKTDGIAGRATLAALHAARTGETTTTTTVTPAPGNTPQPGSTTKPEETSYTQAGALSVGVTLRRGSSSGYVKRLQNALGRLGYFKGTATGYFGTETEAAVRAFQEAKGLIVDGIAGKNTLKAINKQL